MRHRQFLVAAMLAGLAAFGSAAGEDWPQWRGPALNGSTTETNLPTTFGPGEELAWATKLPGVSGATPIIAAGRVFLPAMEPDSKALWALCLDRKTGEVRWKHSMGKGFANRMGNTGASPSAITDGKRVWFTFGTGRIAATDLEGRILWQRNIQEDHGDFEYMWSFGSSPLLYEGKLYLAVLHGHHRKPNRGLSYLLCMDPATGKDLWKAKRVTDARAESQQAYITPFPLTDAPGGAQLLIHGGDYLTGHDPADGRELWRSPDYNTRKDKWWRVVPSAVGTGGVAVGCSPKGGKLFAVRTVASDGKPAGSLLWESRKHSPDVCTPLIYDGKLFVLDGRKKRLACMVPGTGEVIWVGDLGGKAVFQASPTGADGKVYCINLHGEVVVCSADVSFKVLHRVDLGGKGCRASIAAAAGALFVRTDDTLFCFASAAK